jgi:hypothetical protein
MLAWECGKIVIVWHRSPSIYPIPGVGGFCFIQK